MNEEKTVAYIVTGDSLIVRCRGKVGHIFRDDDRFQQAVDLINADDMDELAKLAIPELEMLDYSQLELALVDGQLLRYGEKVPSRLAKIILSLKKDGLPYTHLLNFWDRLTKNPEPSSVEQLFDFLDDHKVPITSEGMIMAYKAVHKHPDGRLLAFHSGHFTLYDSEDKVSNPDATLVRLSDGRVAEMNHNHMEYTIGGYASMPREMVEMDPGKGCGRGLHVGSFEYADDMYSGNTEKVLLEALVDPADVVSVPKDCKCSKIRCCCILPINICGGKAESVVYEPPMEVPKTTTVREKPAAAKKKGSDGTLIGRYYYDKKPIDSANLAELCELENPYRKLIPSDFPLFFKKLCVDKVYRQRNGKTSNYIAGNQGVYVHYTTKG